jgi:hypothetical protein
MNPLKPFLVVLVLVAALAGTALAATPERVVASKTSTGGFALVKLSGTVKTPATLRVRVVAVPRQKVLLTYTVVCAKGGTSAKKVMQYGPTMTPTSRSVPLTVKLPAKCTVSATGQLEQGEGKITVSLLARRR